MNKVAEVGSLISSPLPVSVGSIFTSNLRFPAGSPFSESKSGAKNLTVINASSSGAISTPYVYVPFPSDVEVTSLSSTPLTNTCTVIVNAAPM